MKNKLQGLYGITSQDILLDNNVLFAQVEKALKGGMTILQYRNKHPKPHQNKQDLIRLKKLCHHYDAIFIINDNVELCLKTGADGVHLGKDDVDLVAAREKLGQQSVIGVSCYNDLALAKQAKELGASYIAFGAFYASPTKPEASVATIALLKQAKALKLPICCIGGITPSNAQPLIVEGANMVAVISKLFNSANVKSNAEKFAILF